MKSKLKLVGIIVVLITGFCFWSKQKSELPALALENIEALANGEGGN